MFSILFYFFLFKKKKGMNAASQPFLNCFVEADNLNCDFKNIVHLEILKKFHEWPCEHHFDRKI